LIDRIALVGMMGSGKSEVGRELASRLGLPFHDLDARIETAEKTSIASIFEKRGEGAFRDLERAHLVVLCRDERGVLATGGGTVLDPGNRERLRAWGSVVYLRARAESLAARLRGQEPDARPLLAGAPAVERIEALLAAREAFYYMSAHFVLDTDDLVLNDVVERVRLALRIPPA